MRPSTLGSKFQGSNLEFVSWTSSYKISLKDFIYMAFHVNTFENTALLVYLILFAMLAMCTSV